MRLDKYLKLTRLIKRRGVAKVLINEDKIYVNDKPAKPAYGVKIGDTIKLELGKRIILIKYLKHNNILDRYLYNLRKENSLKKEIIKDKENHKRIKTISEN